MEPLQGRQLSTSRHWWKRQRSSDPLWGAREEGLSAEATINRILETVAASKGNAVQSDDMTCVVVWMEGGERERSLAWSNCGVIVVVRQPKYPVWGRGRHGRDQSPHQGNRERLPWIADQPPISTRDKRVGSLLFPPCISLPAALSCP